MKELNLKATQFDGYAITVTVDGNTQDYAMALLHIFNNVRESDRLLAVHNYSGRNDITVYCVENAKDDLVEYLSNFGEVDADHEKIRCYQVNECWLPERDYEKYYGELVVPYID